jgi:2-furoyl-CoA dehydrogenase large subunit
MAACLEPSGANSTFELLLNPKNETTTYIDSCRINVDLGGAVTATIHTLSAGQGHETLVATVIGEVLEIDPERIRVVRPDSLSSLPSQTPVGSRMAIMLGGAAFHAAQKLKSRLLAIAAHDLKIPPERASYDAGDVFDRAAAQNRRSWSELVTIAHRHFHRMPPNTEPGLAFTHVMQVPTGGQLPTADGRVQMYPCFAFEFHLLLMVIDPDLGKSEIKRYFVGHDCGTVINPKIVRGMTMGGIAHGIGAALYEEFAYDAQGQLVAQSLMDYLLPSAHEVPPVEVIHHVTPSPHTVFGQKGSGESGYLGAPAAIVGAVNDAVGPLGIVVNRLPIKMTQLADMIAAARQRPQAS